MMFIIHHHKRELFHICCHPAMAIPIHCYDRYVTCLIAGCCQSFQMLSQCRFTCLLYTLIEDTDDKIASVRVDHQLFRQYGIPFEKLHEDALRNSLKLFPLRVLPISTLLHESDEADGWKENPAIICITNTAGMYGATSILYPNALHSIATKLDSNLYVIPSSVDEVIVVSDSPSIHPHKLQDLLSEVNSSLLRSDQRLSDHLYYYERRSAQLMAMA